MYKKNTIPQALDNQAELKTQEDLETMNIHFQIDNTPLKLSDLSNQIIDILYPYMTTGYESTPDMCSLSLTLYDDKVSEDLFKQAIDNTIEALFCMLRMFESSQIDTSIRSFADELSNEKSTVSIHNNMYKTTIKTHSITTIKFLESLNRFISTSHSSNQE